LSSGGKLLFTDVVTLVNPSDYLGLIHSSGKVLEFRNPGTYFLKNFIKKYPSGKSNPGLVDSIVAKIIQYQKQVENGKYLYGAFSPELFARMHGGEMETTMLFSAAATKNLPVYDSLYLQWTCCNQRRQKPESYTVTIRDLYTKELFREVIRDTFMVRPIPENQAGTVWIVTLETPLQNSSYVEETSVRITLPTIARQTTIRTELAELKSRLQSEGPLAHTMIGFYFDLKHLHQNAYRSLLVAASKAPKVPLYKMNKEYYLYKNVNYR
jgi:hypothetical protein